MASGTRRGRPCESRPLVESSTSTVRFVVAMLLSHRFAGAQAPAHVVRQILERLSDRQLVFRVPRLGVGGECLTKLLGTTEAAARGEVFAQRIALLVLLPHEEPPEVGVADERDAEHVQKLPLEPIRALVDFPYARN